MMIQAVNITKKFSKMPVLANLNITVPRNRMIALTGQNAIGKTVLLECLAGYKKLFGGQIVSGGAKLPEARLRKDIVYQKRGVFFSPKASIERSLDAFNTLFENYKAKQALQLLGKWNIQLSQTWSELSLGQQQKAEISLFISRPASIYFFDEPFANIDHSAGQELKKCFLQYLPEDSTCVISINNFAGMEGFFTDMWVLKSADELISIDLLEANKSNDLLTLYEEAIECHA